MRRRRTERGFALLIVLWSLVILALLGTHVVATGRTEALLASNLRDAAMAEAAADGAVHRTLFNLLGLGTTRWPPQGRFRVMLGGVPVDVAVENLTGRVNPNTAAPELMRAVLRGVGVEGDRAAALADAIADWRAPGPKRPHGAQAAEYRAAGRDYGPAGRPFRSLDELGAVLGMTPDLLARLRPHLTLWWESDPDPAFADPVVTAALSSLGEIGPSTGGAARPVQAVAIRATAAGPGGARFTREADAILNAGNPGTDWRILTWTVPAL